MESQSRFGIWIGRSSLFLMIRQCRNNPGMPSIAARLAKISIPPSGGEAFDLWLKHQDTLSLLEDNLREDDIVLYASFTYTFMHMVLVPDSLLNPPDIADLMSWNCNTHSSWGVSYN